LIAAGAALGAPAWARAAALAVLLGMLPGWIVARRVAPRLGGAGAAALGIAISPFLVAAPAALLRLAGLGLTAGARVMVLAVAALAVADAFMGRRADPTDHPGAGDATSWRIAGAGVAMVLLAQLGNPALAGRSDGAFHAAVTLAVSRGGLPPEDPHFAGLHLLYFWGADLWAALWLAAAPALAVWTPLVALDLLALAAALLGVCALARRLGGGARTQWLAAGLAAFGAAPFAWLAVAARAALGQVRGAAELSRLLAQGVDPALASMSTGLLHPSLVLPLDKFVVVTPFSTGLALTMAFALAALEMDERPGRRPGLAVALVVGAALFVHTIVGGALIGCGVAMIVTGAARGRVPSPAWLLALGAPALLLTPYVASFAAARPDAGVAGPWWRALTTLIVGGALVVPAGLLALARGAGGALVAPALALAAAGLLGRLEGDNQSKLFNLLFMLLSAPAALTWSGWLGRWRGMGRTALAALLTLAVVPTALLCAWAYAAERGQQPYSFHAPAPALADACGWARDSLAAGAILIDPAAQSEGATLTVLTRRSLLWGGEFLARKWGYAPAALDVRRRAAAAVAAGEPLPRDAVALARDLGRPWIEVRRRAADEPVEDFARRARGEPGRTRVLYVNPVLAFLALEGAP
jgi:hypothetical protein